MFESIRLQSQQDIPLYQQLTDALLAQIKNGALPAESRLPTVRELAQQLNVARGTVKRAYDELEMQGAISKAQGRGTFVSYQPISEHSRKERAMTAIDALFRELEQLNFSMTEINIFLNLKLRQLADSQSALKVAVVECNPEILSQLMEQLRTGMETLELFAHLLPDVEKYPYRIGEDMDLIITTAEHADVLKDIITQKNKIAKIALRLVPSSVAQILRLTPGETVGILCQSQRFGELVHSVCAGYTEGVEILPPLVWDSPEETGAYFRKLTTLVVPEGFEKSCPAEVLQQTETFGAKRTLIRCQYQVDEGSYMYLNERIERLKEKKRI